MKSLWEKQDSHRHWPQLKEDKTVQVLVIGGGMAGVLCAWKLQQAGKKVILVEAERVGGGITAKTTAVLTAQHDYLYQDMTRDFGAGFTRDYLHGNLDAVKEFRKLAKKIPCDFEDMPSVQYTTDNLERLCKEADIVNGLGFSAKFIEKPDFPKDATGCVEYPEMAQFHPEKFLLGIAQELEIYEQSRVMNIEGTTAKLEYATVQAEQIVVATHFPFINRKGFYFLKLYQNRSYVMAFENAPLPKASLAELEGQGMYFRRYGELLLVGGGDHRTGRKGEGFAYLRNYARQHFPEAREKYAWANQDCVSLDGLPYVGSYSPSVPGVYVATGFNGWGMTNSMVAANIICDMICGKENALAHTLRPNRSMMHKQLLCNIAATAADFAIPTVKRCPHLGCALKWNSQERSWDCLCHGSRFSEEGKLLDTPAQKDLDTPSTA